MPQEQSLLAFLTSHADAHVNVDRVDTRRLRQWLADLDLSSREGVRRAWLVGRALNAERAKLKRGEVEAWEKARARELGRKRRTLQVYRYVAEHLEDEKIAASLRITHADAGLFSVVRAIRKAHNQVSPQPSKSASEKMDAWQARAKRLLASVQKLDAPRPLLEAHIAAAQELLAALEESDQSGPTVRQAVDLYLEHLKADRQGASLLRESMRILNLLAAHVGPDLPVHDLTTATLTAFAATLPPELQSADARLPEALTTAMVWWQEQGWVVAH